MTLPTTFEITLEFLSDWHVGTGQGRRGTIDAEVRRDGDELPFVPAKTLVGVWRDACETVAATFDRAAGPAQAWQAWVTWLFGAQATGSPVGADRAPAALRLTPARVPAWLAEGVRGHPGLAQAAVVPRPGVTIDDKTGTAADRLLRVEERALRGMRLHSRVSVAAPGATDDADHLPVPAELLLRAGARLVEAVGGKRNRGSGRVAFLLPGSRVHGMGSHPTVTDSQLIELLADGVPAPPSPPPPARDLVEVYPYGRLHLDPRRVVRVVLRVLTPVVAAHEVLGNVIVSRDTIPGTALLGTILRRVESTRLDGGGRPARIGLDDLRVGDAVPAAGDPLDPTSVTPARPVPAVWYRGDKGRGATVRNALASEQVADERAKRMSGWIVADGAGWRHVATARTVSTHAVVDDEARRPTVASAGVYTYLGIAPGTLLCTDIVLPADVRLRLNRGEQLRFGRSRKDDFGLVEVVGVVPLPASSPPVVEPRRLRVWCVSDVLLRDERLAPDPSPQALARALSAALAPALVEVDGPPTGVTATRRDGFGVAWGRPRPSQVALGAGSVVSCTMVGPVDSGRLAELERDGIGERTAEGFGRIRFNPPELTIAQPLVDFAVRAAKPKSQPARMTQTGDLAEPVHPIEINAWRRAIRRASTELRPEDLIPGIDRLAGRRAQLGSLRAQLERLALPGGADMVRTWLAGTRAVRARRETWTDVANGTDVLNELAGLLLDDRNRVWERLGLAGPQPGLVLAPGREAAVRERLHTEALLTSVTSVLRSLTQAPAGTNAPTGTSTARPAVPSPAACAHRKEAR